MVHDVFISYSSKDKPTGDAVCATLEGRGIRCWIAPRDIVPGSDWGEAIVEGIEQSRIMVLVFSKSANSSPQVKREVERAVNKGLIIIPLRIEDVLPGKNLEYFLSTPHWLDALTRPLEAHLNYLADTVALLLQGKAVEPRSSESVAPPRFSPVQIVGALVVAVALVGLLVWVLTGGGDTGSALVPATLVGTWDVRPQPDGPSAWTVTFTKDGKYSGEVVFEEAGVISDFLGETDSKPIAATSGGTVQQNLVPSAGSQHAFTWTPSADGSQSVYGLIPNSMIIFSTVGTTNANLGVFYGSNWMRISPTEWQLSARIGPMTWAMTFTAEFGKYVFHASHVEKGTFDAADGKWRMVSDDGRIVEGAYSFTSDGSLTFSSNGLNSLWKKAKG